MLSPGASLPDGGDNNTARIADSSKSEYLPSDPEAYTHDLDGNLLTDGQWQYTWDANNRLIEMETLAVAYTAGASRQKLEFAYDSQGRRFSKKVSKWDATSSTYEKSVNYLYLYDGWNLIAELESILTPNFTLHAAYVWGLDFSGTMQGAGGVGGLLAVTSSASTAYPSYDGNGNVMGYYDATNGTSVAEFEYGPFGELIRATGSKVDEFNFRFSTKYEDAETGLLYYGYRYYDPVTGRWLSRDPIGEEGGPNLYGFVYNSPEQFYDILGGLPDSFFPSFIEDKLRDLSEGTEGILRDALSGSGEAIESFFLSVARSAAEKATTGDFSYQGRWTWQPKKKLRFLEFNLRYQVRAKTDGCCIYVAVGGGAGGRAKSPVRIPKLLFSKPVFISSGNFEFFYRVCDVSSINSELGSVVEEFGGHVDFGFSLGTRWDLDYDAFGTKATVFVEGAGSGKYYYEFGPGISNGELDIGFYGRAVADFRSGSKVRRFERKWGSGDVF